MSSDPSVGNRDAGALLRDGKRADAPTHRRVWKFAPDRARCPKSLRPGCRLTSRRRFGRARGEVSGVTADLNAPAPAPVAATPKEPNFDPQSYIDMMCEELHIMRRQRGARSLLITRPPAKDQIETKTHY